MINRILKNWLQKLAALLLALILWFSVNLTDTSTSQRSLTIPVTIEGLQAGQTVSEGVPATVNIVVSGPSAQVNRLRPENFDAILNLSNLLSPMGDFERQITVVPPQGILLQSVDPETAIGTVETIISKTIPVEVALLGTLPEDAVVRVIPALSEVSVRGRNSTLSSITKAVAMLSVQQESSEVVLYAVDAENRPITEVALEPSSLSVSIVGSPILYSKRLAINLAEPEVSPFQLEALTLSQDSLEVVGSKELLNGLEAIGARVDLGEPLEAGTQTLNVIPELPAGIKALETITVQLSLMAPSEPAGETDDSTRSPIR